MAENADQTEDDLFEQAVIWDARLRELGAAPGAAPDAAMADRAAFDAWLAEDPRHGAAHREAQALWPLTELPARSVLRDGAQRRITVPGDWLAQPQVGASPAVQPQGRHAVGGRMRRVFAFRRLAAAAAVLAITVAAWGYRGGFDDLRADYVTATGEQQDVTLGDNSRIKLNTDTAFAADLAGTRRLAHLYRGEAFFDIAPDATRPFIVETPLGRVTVLGTALNIRLDDGRMVVSVDRGHVAVTSRHGASDAGAAAHLLAGQQVRVDGDRLDGVTGFDAATVEAWRDGQLVFYRTPLGTVIDELNRYRQGRILIVDPALKNRVVSGIFDLRQPDKALATLEKTLHLRSTNLANLLILLD